MHASERTLHFRLYFDGGSRGNPGPSYGSYRMQVGSAAPEPVVRVSFGHGTNNAAEYRALIAGLRGLRQRLEREGLSPVQVSLEVLGDSMLVVEQMSGRWKVKDHSLQVLWDEAQRLVRGLGQIRFIRHPRRRSVALLGH
jgi:ribonuclease HI